MTATLPAQVNAARDVVRPALRAAIDELDPGIAKVVGYHFGWLDACGDPVPGNGGKALRPALALLSAQAAGMPSDDAVPAATAVELIHNFSLLHDDVMDGDRERRHRATAWTVFGMPAAILAGDALLTLAVEVARRRYDGPRATAVIGCLDEAVQRLIAGQSADVGFEQRADVTLSECLDMAAAKTGALMRCATSVGALAVGAPASTVARLAEFGEHIGLAFQLIDDLLGIWGTPEVTGKPALADLRVKKKSVPVVVALNANSVAGETFRDVYLRPEPFHEDDLPALAELVERAGGAAWTQSEADRHIQLARNALDSVGAPEGVHQALWSTALFVTGRDR
ncbi:MAG: polyprenyl synthetase family protein [Sciscionella sp.]